MLCLELEFAADNDYANLILIWPHCYFQQKNVKVMVFQKYLCYNPSDVLTVYHQQICLKF